MLPMLAGMKPVKVFPSSTKSHTLEAVENSGMLPSKEFPLRSRLPRTTLCPTAGGIVPAIPLLSSQRTSNFGDVPSEGLSVPVKLLLFKIIFLSCRCVKRNSGSVPVNSLSVKLRYLRRVRFTREFGRVPPMVLLAMSTFVRPDKYPISCGIDPSRLFASVAHE